MSVWVPHTLSEKNKEYHISVVTNFPFQTKEMTIFSRISLQIKKIGLLSPHKRQEINKDSLTQKRNFIEKKVMCVCWDHHVIIHFKFLNLNQELNADLDS